MWLPFFVNIVVFLMLEKNKGVTLKIVLEEGTTNG